MIDKQRSRLKLRGRGEWGMGRGVGKNLRKNRKLPCFCMSLGESLSFSAMLEKYFSKIIKLSVCVCVEGLGEESRVG